MTEAQKKRLEQQLWNIANELRGKMSADEFRDYILGFIFYKYLSEKQHLYANSLLETESIKDYADVKDEEDIELIREESLAKLGYFLRPDELFAAITKKGNADTEETSNFILEDLQGILNSIEQSTMGTDSEDDFNQLFEDLDLNSTKLGRAPNARNDLIAKVLSHLDKTRIKNAYDPACGSGSLLLRIAREAEVGEFFGQELNRTTYNLARMNMILHDVHFEPPRVYRRDICSKLKLLYQRYSGFHRRPPLLLVA